MPRRNNRDKRMDPRVVQFLRERDREAPPSGKPVSRKKNRRRRDG